MKPNELIIYEAHVRGFTIHSDVKHPGTFLGFIEKIPYLLDLGINAVELMPIFDFKPPNYWGYQPVSWLKPHPSYGTVDEFKTLVRELHQHGIEVILDVVYNHTEKGVFPSEYYLKHDYTGCGNTVNTNHPEVQKLILESLRFWSEECGVDGFRFDLASVFTRGTDGHVLDHPPIVEKISKLNVKLIAEAWDATGLYQLNFFPKFGPWSEWNGVYRDIVRRFIKGTDGKAGRFANAMSGSEVVYATTKTPTTSINFVTAHDGFCLRDLVSYQQKHNEANGEGNRDGTDQNDNWNCGAEGNTDDPEILALRERQMRNFWMALLLAQGVPMILMGDEYGHTRHGNNNPYNQDNETNWFLWDRCRENEAMRNFVKRLIAFRKQHPELHRDRFLTSHDVTWHGQKVGHANWAGNSRFVAWSTSEKPRLYVAFNAGFEGVRVELPEGRWELVVHTERGWDQGDGEGVAGGVEMGPYSAVLLKEKI